MTAKNSFWSLWLLLVAAIALGGCTGSWVGSDAACRGAQWIESRLFFGRDISSGGQVTEEMWRDFVDQVVAPRFGDGFTVIDGIGFWFNQDTDKVENERSKILIVLHPEDSDLRRKLEETAGVYITRFRQHAVLADSQPTCVTFYQRSP